MADEQLAPGVPGGEKGRTDGWTSAIRAASISAIGLGAGAGRGPGRLGLLRAITPARAADMKVGPDAVRFRPEIEPVVRWIEETPREQALEVAVAHLKEGLSYRDLLAGLFLAGIRNIKPHPVGFKFHAVMVINSAHLLGQTAAVSDRLLPLLWALDNFKKSQAQDIKEGDWTLGKVDEAHLPSPDRAEGGVHSSDGRLGRRRGRRRRRRALPHRGGGRGDGAVLSLRRPRPARTSATRRSSPCSAGGPCRRSAGSMPSPSSARSPSACSTCTSDSRHVAVGPYEANLENAKKVRDGWQVGKPDPAATRSLLETIRQARPSRPRPRRSLLNRGHRPRLALGCGHPGRQRVADADPGHPRAARGDLGQRPALHLRRQRRRDQPHASPCSKPSAGSRCSAAGSSPPRPLAIDALEPKTSEAKGDEAVSDIFATIDKSKESKDAAAAKAVGYLNAGGSTDLLFAAARRMIFHKGRDSHDYKYGAAAWEECVLASDPKWRTPLAAAMMFNLPGSKTPDSPLMNEAREAVSHVLG